MDSEYERGFKDGIRAYAYMKDGQYYVGTTGRTLERAIAEVKQTWTWNFMEPKNDSK
jgi:hypothetical protein